MIIGKIKYISFMFLIYMFLFYRLVFAISSKPIIIIASYDLDNLCSSIQIRGIRDKLAEKNIIPYRIIYVKFRKVNTSEISRIDVVDSIFEKYHVKDYLFILIDDLSFQYFISNMIDITYFSGINAPLSYYKDLIHTTICGVVEVYDFNRLTNILKKLNPVNEVVVIYDTNSNTSKMIYKLFKSNCPKNIEYRYIQVNTISDLNNIYKNINNRDLIVISLILNIKDNDKLVNFNETSIIIRKYINKSFLIGVNPLQIGYGYDAVVTASFYDMGQTTAQMILDHKCQILKSDTYIIINSNHCFELGGQNVLCR